MTAKESRILTRDEMEARRFRGAELLVEGFRQAEVSRQMGVSRTSVSRWAAWLDRNGRGLQSQKATGRPPLKSAQAIRTMYDEAGAPPVTVFGLRDMIENNLGVTYSRDHVYRLARRCHIPVRSQ